MPLRLVLHASKLLGSASVIPNTNILSNLFSGVLLIERHGCKSNIRARVHPWKVTSLIHLHQHLGPVATAMGKPRAP